MQLPLIVRLAGGLGNQLFQLAKAIELQNATGRTVLLDSSPYYRRIRRDQRGLCLPVGETPITITRRYSPLSLLLSRLGRPVHLNEDRSGVVGRSTILVTGYHQVLRTATAAGLPLINFLTSQIERTRIPMSGDYVALHSRLGDYLNPSIAKSFGVTDPNWLMRIALNQARELGIGTVVVFTDSPSEFRKRLARGFKGKYEISTESSPWGVLGGLSEARSLIMSNSSLSWWAGYLNSSSLLPSGRRPGVVIAPQPWFATFSETDEALYNSEWIYLDRKIL